MRVYPYGYAGKSKTELEYATWSVWQAFDPEFARRLRAVMEYAHDAGHPVGVGGGIRSTIGQLGLFLSRHHMVTSGGCCTYKGTRYALNAGAAHAAPPGTSYHEETTPDGKCLAADMIGDLAWINPQLAQFGLKHFANVNGEPWHWQGVDYPNSRRDYDPAKHHPLPVFPLPGTTPPPPQPPIEDDMLILEPVAQVYDTRKAGGAFAANEVRSIPVSFGGSAAMLRLTAIATSEQGGWVRVWGTVEGEHANVNFTDLQPLGQCLAETKLVNGVVQVRASAPCHLIIETQAVSA